jgi:hypothetical protein
LNAQTESLHDAVHFLEVLVGIQTANAAVAHSHGSSREKTIPEPVIKRAAARKTTAFADFQNTRGRSGNGNRL